VASSSYCHFESLAFNGHDGQIKMSVNPTFHVKWVPCHQGMICPQVLNGGNGLQVWRVAANILNEHLWTAEKDCPSSLWVGLRLTTLHCLTSAHYEILLRTSDLDEFRGTT
jgi:hypothetical protein